MAKRKSAATVAPSVPEETTKVVVIEEMPDGGTVPEKLVGEGRSGDFVHENQVMGSEDGFKNVSKIWLDKTMTFEQGLERLAAAKKDAEDIMANPQQMIPAVGSNDEFVLKHVESGREYKPTTWCMDKLSVIAGIGTWYGNSLLENPTDPKGRTKFTRDRRDAETLVTSLLNGLRRCDQKRALLWRVNNGNMTARAVFSDKYAVIDNEWFVETLHKIIPGGRLSHWKDDSDTIWGNVLIPDSIRVESDSDYGGLLAISNSEIGIRRLDAVPSLFRAICMNGCIWDEKKGKGLAQVHRGHIPLEWLFQRIKEHVEAQIPLLPKFLDSFLQTRTRGWDGDSIKPLFAQVALSNKIEKSIAAKFLEAYHTEKELVDEKLIRTQFGVVNSVTRAAQSVTAPKDWVRLDTLGGELAAMDDKAWSALTSRAKNLTVEEVEEAFA